MPLRFLSFCVTISLLSPASLPAQIALDEQDGAADAATHDDRPAETEQQRPGVVARPKKPEDPLAEKTFKDPKNIIKAIPEDILPPANIRRTNAAYTLIYRQKLLAWFRQFSALGHRVELRLIAKGPVTRDSSDSNANYLIFCRTAEGKPSWSNRLEDTSFTHAGLAWALEVGLVFRPDQADALADVNRGTNLTIAGTLRSFTYHQGPHVVLPDGRGGVVLPVSIVVEDVEIRKR